MSKWIKDFMSPPKDVNTEYTDTVYILHSITLWGVPVLLLISLIRILNGEDQIDAIHIFIGIVMLTFLVGRAAIHLGYFRAVGRMILIVAWAGITYLAWVSDGLQDNSLLPYMTIIFASALLLSEADTLILSAFCIAAIWGIAYADATGLRVTDNPQDSFNLALNLSINFSLSTVAVYYMIRTLHSSLGRRQEELNERRQIENALRENEERFRVVFEASPVAICITTLADGRLLEANYAYWELMGYKPEDAIGKTSEELKLWDTVGERDAFVEILKQKGSHYDPDFSFDDEHGKRKDAIGFYKLARIGSEDRVISMFYDMSAQKQTMRALQQSESRVRALLDAIPDMILEISLDGLVTNMIPPKGMEKSMPVEDYIGKRIYDIFPETAASQTLFAIKRAIQTYHMNVFEFEAEMGDDHQILEARVVRCTFTTVIMMIRIVTQRRWIEAEREKLINELEIKNKESETLRESLASIVTMFDLKEIVEQILDQIKLVIPYDTASVWQFEGNWQSLLVARDLPPEFDVVNMRLPLDEDNSSTPIIEGEKPFVLSNNVQEELLDFTGPHSYINSWLAVPLKTRGKVIGLIALDGRRKDQFTQHHADLAVTFADQVAIAFDNTSLFTELQVELEQRKWLIAELEKKNAEAETLRESLAVIVGTFDFSRILNIVLDQIHRVIPYDSATIWRMEGENQILVVQRDVPFALEPGFIFPVDEQNHALPIFKGELPFIISHNVQAEFSNFQEEPNTYINSWLGVPIKMRGRIMGLIALDGRERSQFNQNHVELAIMFSNQVAIALENAGLFQNLQNELEERQALIKELERKNIESETLRESAAIVTATLEKDIAIDRILDQLERVIPFDSASVQLLDGNFLEIVSTKGYPRSDDEADNRFEIGEDEPAYPILRGDKDYVLYANIQEHFPSFSAPPHNRIRAWIAVPLRVKGKTIGVIALDGYQAGEFTERHAQLAVTYANQVAIAFENARLFSDLQAELAARKELITELEAKNAELERFTYTVSHDLKSPLFTIRGFLGYLEQDALSSDRERLRSDVQRINDATDKMQNLLNDLLQLSRIGRIGNEPEIISFNELADEAISLVQGRIDERGITVHVAPDLPQVFGDKVRLLEVVQNLVDNAAKFMGDQKTPRIEIGQDGEEDRKPILYVRDNGIGIASEHHERVFGLFNKLDVKADGTGIGLALVKRIIEVHGGRIWIESDLGKGATFYFTLAGSGT